MWKAGEQLRQNIEALLTAQKARPSDLAFALKKHRSWMTRFLNRQRQELQLSDVDKIAAFFGVSTYQLFAPGISRLTERRQGERRVGRERRIGHALRGMQVAAAEVAMHRPHKKDAHVAVAPPPSPAAAELHRLIADFERLTSRLLTRAESGGQAPDPRRALPEARPRRRAAGGSDHPKP